MAARRTGRSRRTRDGGRRALARRGSADARSGGVNVGVVGCGVIAGRYVTGSAAFDSFGVIACSDTDAERSQTLGAEHGLLVEAVDELIADPPIEGVLNLTPPQAHTALVGAALSPGQHLSTDKPLPTSVAGSRGLPHPPAP